MKTMTQLNKHRSIGWASACALCAAVMGLAGVHANAALITQDFQSPLDGLPSDWDISSDGMTLEKIIAHSSWTHPNPPDNSLYFRRDADGENRANVWYVDDPEQDPPTFSDLSGSILLSVTGASTVAGVLVRMPGDGTNRAETTGYYIGIQNRDTLFISRDPLSNHTTPGTVLTSTTITSIGNNNTARLEFSAMGDTLSASAYAWDSDLSDWAFRGSIETTDSTYSEGLFGIRTQFSATRRSAWYTDLTVIPEPGSVGLFGMAGLALLLRRKLRR